MPNNFFDFKGLVVAASKRKLYTLQTSKILISVVSIEDATTTLVNLEKNPGNYMKVVVKIGAGYFVIFRIY